MEKLETHEAEADHQQQDVEHLGHHGQPQHAYRHQQTLSQTRTREDEDSKLLSLCLSFVLPVLSNKPQTHDESSDNDTSLLCREDTALRAQNKVRLFVSDRPRGGGEGG